MNAIEKAKEALRTLTSIPAYAYSDNEAACRMWDIAHEALAALETEKPVEDAQDLAERILEGVANCGCDDVDDADIDTEAIAKEIQSFAESYHEKKCDECKTSEWISVKDRLPEDDKRVLVYADSGIEILTYNAHYSCWDDESGDDFEHHIEWATHWQPLPEPPNV